MRSRLTFFAVAMALLFAGAQTARPAQPRQLSLAERVAYQYAIEEVYWRHRIWPKENPGPKPSLDAVMSPTQIEKKVNDYLRSSQLLAETERAQGKRTDLVTARHQVDDPTLAEKWQGPITPEQLQAELERMARDTKQPDMLREIFAALGNDPFVIAECLARAILAQRFVTELTAHNISETRKVSTAVKPDNSAYTLPQISVPVDCADDTWTATSLTNAPTARADHTAIWTGSEMIVWGGAGENPPFTTNTGGRYDPATDSWDGIAASSAVTPRYGHTAVWTGTEMVVWGGRDNKNRSLNTGGKYNPTTDSWITTSTDSTPIARINHTAIWTGSEVIIWGGYNDNTGFDLNTGGRYDPGANSWTATITNDAPTARESHTAVWTGTEMIIWGGVANGPIYFNTGGRYNPGTDSWTATSTTGAPDARRNHTAVWTSSEMIVWGGYTVGSGVTNAGGRYDPTTDSWTPTNTGSAPSARAEQTAVWTGSEMIIWGGSAGNTGRRYYPLLNIWTPTNTGSAPTGRTLHSGVWTGSEMIVWGGLSPVTNTGGRYCARQPPAPVATSRKMHGFVGQFDIALPLTGATGIECRTGGTTNDYVMVVAFSGSVTVNGNPQAAVTAGVGSVGSDGTPNGGMVTVSGNIVTVPLTNVADAQTISVTLFGINGASNVAIPMSILVGDFNGSGAVNAGDIVGTKSRIGQAVNATNFRSDVNASGAINATDVSIVKSYTGTGLP